MLYKQKKILQIINNIIEMKNIFYGVMREIFKSIKTFPSRIRKKYINY